MVDTTPATPDAGRTYSDGVHRTFNDPDAQKMYDEAVALITHIANRLGHVATVAIEDYIDYLETETDTARDEAQRLRAERDAARAALETSKAPVRDNESPFAKSMAEYLYSVGHE